MNECSNIMSGAMGPVVGGLMRWSHTCTLAKLKYRLMRLCKQTSGIAVRFPRRFHWETPKRKSRNNGGHSHRPLKTNVVGGLNHLLSQ